MRLVAWDRRTLRLAQGDREYAFAVPSMPGFAFLVGVIGTAYLGARCQRHVPQRRLKGFLALLLMGLALRYAWPG